MLYEKVYGCLLGGLIGDAMGAPVENWHYKQIQDKYGVLQEFEGNGTDDSAVKQLICEALLKNDGHIGADHFAGAVLNHPEMYDLYYIPVRNMYHKLKDDLTLPIDAGYGNMQSSSSAMAISPMGIINACNPRQAALEAYDVAGVVHSGPTNFCRDAACAIAAATAEAMNPHATVASVLEAATAFLHPKSAHIMRSHIKRAMEMAEKASNYEAFREVYYAKCLYDVICDSRETVPAALAIFYLSQGDPVTCIINGANFGRDADTIATMVGALAGAFKGIDAFKPEWIIKIEQHGDQHMKNARALTALAIKKAESAAKAYELIHSM